ncbi:MAG: hypothetical protein ACI86C_000100 [Candidatus Latescibacterota bacterium]|jgi:hypothetical protein
MRLQSLRGAFVNQSYAEIRVYQVIDYSFLRNTRTPEPCRQKTKTKSKRDILNAPLTEVMHNTSIVLGGRNNHSPRARKIDYNGR